MCFKFFEICGEKIRVLRNRCVSCSCYVLLSSRQNLRTTRTTINGCQFKFVFVFGICLFLQIVRLFTRKTTHNFPFSISFQRLTSIFTAGQFFAGILESLVYIFTRRFRSLHTFAYLTSPNKNRKKQKPRYKQRHH